MSQATKRETTPTRRVSGGSYNSNKEIQNQYTQVLIDENGAVSVWGGGSYWRNYRYGYT